VGNPFGDDVLLCPYQGCKIRKPPENLRIHIERLHERRRDRVDPRKVEAVRGKLAGLVLSIPRERRARKAG
jgi:hypothetical protein